MSTKRRLTETYRFPQSTIKGKVECISYDPDNIWEGDLATLADLEKLLGKRAVTWVNMEGSAETEFLNGLSSIFGFHELAMEDAIHVHQRAKVDDYGNYLFIVLRMVVPGDVPDFEQLSIFLGKNFVLTVQEREGGDGLDIVRNKLRKKLGRLRTESADFLAYAIIDAVVDGYFPVLEKLGERIENLEDQIFIESTEEDVEKIHEIKRDVLTTRKAVWPLRDMLYSLKSDLHPMISDITRVYLKDCYDHTLRVLDLVEIYRELAHDLRDIHLTSMNNKLNEVMKVLTIITTIFIPPTLIAGIYGMNFDPKASPINMPELNWPFGYVFSLCLMVAVSAGLLLYLRRKGWLSSSSPSKHNRKTG